MAHAPEHSPGKRRLRMAQPKMARDPVCGMDVPEDAPLRTSFDGKTYVFCNERCLQRFEANPRAFLDRPAPSPHAGRGMET